MFKPKVIPFKSREDIEKEVTEILEGKGNHPHAGKLRKAAKVLSAFKTKEEIKELFIEEYVKKYGLLQTGKISLDELKKQSVAEIKKTGTKV
jgi:hypothetical protein